MRAVVQLLSSRKRGIGRDLNQARHETDGRRRRTDEGVVRGRSSGAPTRGRRTVHLRQIRVGDRERPRRRRGRRPSRFGEIAGERRPGTLHVGPERRLDDGRELEPRGGGGRASVLRPERAGRAVQGPSQRHRGGRCEVLFRPGRVDGELRAVESGPRHHLESGTFALGEHGRRRTDQDVLLRLRYRSGLDGQCPVPPIDDRSSHELVH
mmetsp:Transcript_14685/g.28100  ORF Transcript_14685/g.28100 Transcript_14685/m.28100 type:complete len:209 (-) Transcript_14685:397-1023(-)